ncbi:hypothetical protein Bca101_053876 [Brassica carinata]
MDNFDMSLFLSFDLFCLSVLRWMDESYMSKVHQRNEYNAIQCNISLGLSIGLSSSSCSCSVCNGV